MNLCKKICKECPFHKESSRGWLGHHKIEEVMHMQQTDYPFTCHMQRKDDSVLDDVINGEIDVCRGYVASASKSAKLFGQHPVYGQPMRELQKQITEEDKEQVLTRWEFKPHHDIFNE